MDEEYKQSDISKEVQRLMDEEGYEFGEAVKEAMAKGMKDGGLMIAIQRFAQGGGVGSLMQPRINFKGGGMDASKSDFGKSKFSQSNSPGHPSNKTTNPSTNKATSGGGGGNNNNGGGGGGGPPPSTNTGGSGGPPSSKKDIPSINKDFSRFTFSDLLKSGYFDKKQYEEDMQMAKVFNTKKDLIGLGAAKDSYFDTLTPQGKALEKFRNSAVNFKKAEQNTANTPQAALGFMQNKPGLFSDVLDNQEFIQSAIDKGFLADESDYTNQLAFEKIGGFADGGGVGSLMQPKRQGLFMGGSPLSGEALAIYNSMNSYGYTDQDIADKLLSLNLYTPPGTTPPGTPPPGTPPPGGGNNGGNGGGDGGAGTTTKTTTTDPNTFNADTFDDKTIIDKYVYDRPYSMKDVAGDGLTTTTTSKNAFEETAPTTSVLEKIISSNKPTMLDIAGNSLPFNIETLGNPTNDSRIVSEELGSTGFGKPNITNVSGKELAGTTAPSIEKAISTFSRPTMADVANDLEKGPITMENIGAPDIPSDYDNFGQFGFGNFAEFGPQTIGDLSNIGMAKDPEGVEDPYGGKYTASFEEKKAAEGLVAGLVDKIKSSSYNPMQLDNIITSFTSRGIFDLAGINNPYGLLSSAAGLGYNYFKKKLSKNKAATEAAAAAAAAKNKQEIKDIQSNIDKQETTINQNASNNDSKTGASTVNPNSAYGKKQGYTGGNPNPHTDTGWSGSSKSNKSNKSNKSSGTKSGGGGKGGGADSGGSKGGSKGGGSKNSSQQGGGFNSYGFSDIRLKNNIELVGKSNLDINIYNFTYLNDPTVYQGVMAHEVPWASVEHDSGYLMVDYNKIDVDFKIIH